jgi:MSHA biogenesis protein MshN
MSVINQMLRDLDARDASDNERAGLPRRLRTLPPAAKSDADKWRTLALGMAMGAAITAIAAFALRDDGNDTPPPLPPVQAGSAVAPAEAGEMKLSTLMAASAPAPAQPATAAPAPPARRPAPAATAPESPKPAAASRETPPAARAAAQPAPAPAEPAPEAQIDKRAKGAGTAHDMAEAEYRKGMQAVKRGDAVAAQPHFLKALEFDPAHAKARQALLSILVGGRQWQEARQVAESGLALDPAQSGWAVILARLQFEHGDAAAALATLERHAGHAAGDAEYQGLFAYLLQKQQRPEEAAGRFRTALALRPGEGRWWFGLGVALEAAGRAGEAKDAYAKARAAGNLPADMAAVAEQKVR